MKKEDLLKAMNEIDSELLKSSEYKKNQKGWIKWAVMAAGLALVLFAAITVDISPRQGDSQVAGGNESQSEEGAQNENQLQPISDEEYVEIEAILAKVQNTEGITEQSLRISMIQKDGYTMSYELIDGIDQATLEESLGKQLDDTNWYYVKGYNEMQYMIEKNEEGYDFWKFMYCENESYPYEEILQKMYGVTSAGNIAKIIVEPSTINNTDEGKKLQEQIGTKEITDASQIQVFYEALSSRTCYGDDNWDMIDLGDDYGQGMVEAVTKVRYLTIETTAGVSFEMKYTALSDMFYEYGGVAYDPLSKEQAAAVEKMLGIE